LPARAGRDLMLCSSGTVGVKIVHGSQFSSGALEFMAWKCRIALHNVMFDVSSGTGSLTRFRNTRASGLRGASPPSAETNFGFELASPEYRTDDQSRPTDFSAISSY